MALAEVSAPGVKAEGVFQQENVLRSGQDRPGSLTLTAGAGGRGSYTKVSAAVACPVADRTGAAGPAPGYDEHVRL